MPSKYKVLEGRKATSSPQSEKGSGACPASGSEFVRWGPEWEKYVMALTKPYLVKMLRESAMEAARYREALVQARDMIESEYCSHPGPHSAGEQACYADFIYDALTQNTD